LAKPGPASAEQLDVDDVAGIHPELVGELTAQHEARGREGELAPVAVDMCRKPRVRCARFDRRALGPAA